MSRDAFVLHFYFSSKWNFERGHGFDELPALETLPTKADISKAISGNYPSPNFVRWVIADWRAPAGKSDELMRSEAWDMLWNALVEANEKLAEEQLRGWRKIWRTKFSGT